VYSRNPGEPAKHEVARALLRRLWVEQSGRTSIQALNEFYVVCTRKVSRPVSPEQAWAGVEEFLEWNPLPVDAALLRRARSLHERYELSWWDALIVAAAQLQGCVLLYSEDMQHGAVYDGVKVINPFVAQVPEEPPPYRMQLPDRHRPRGRPRGKQRESPGIG